MYKTFKYITKSADFPSPGPQMQKALQLIYGRESPSLQASLYSSFCSSAFDWDIGSLASRRHFRTRQQLEIKPNKQPPNKQTTQTGSRSIESESWLSSDGSFVVTACEAAVSRIQAQLSSVGHSPESPGACSLPGIFCPSESTHQLYPVDPLLCNAAKPPLPLHVGVKPPTSPLWFLVALHCGCTTSSSSRKMTSSSRAAAMLANQSRGVCTQAGNATRQAALALYPARPQRAPSGRPACCQSTGQRPVMANSKPHGSNSGASNKQARRRGCWLLRREQVFARVSPMEDGRLHAYYYLLRYR